MIDRHFWKSKIIAAWEKTSVVWLTGVRRSGKTTLCKSFNDALYLNCDLRDVDDMLRKPEVFFPTVQDKIIILDEIHQLADPSRVLKIAADEFPHLKVLATGSSTLAATRKFRDSLTGRKRSLELSPVLFCENALFGVSDIRHRLLRGGLPPALLSRELDPEFYAEWLDSYFARDVQELFAIQRRQGFLKLFELLMRQSGGLSETTSLASHAGLSRPTVMNYLDVFEITHVLHPVRPFHGGGRQEILHQPKYYGFDTGFVCFAKSWRDIRPEDGGLLWEHLVLDELRAHLPSAQRIHFWRDKSKREIDFVIPTPDHTTWAIECKWNEENWDPSGFQAFRTLHPNGRNIVVCPFVTRALKRTFGRLDIDILTLTDLTQQLKGYS